VKPHCNESVLLEEERLHWKKVKGGIVINFCTADCAQTPRAPPWGAGGRRGGGEGGRRAGGGKEGQGGTRRDKDEGDKKRQRARR
jgi:hypothetical protein